MIFQKRIWDFIGNGNFGFLPKFLGKKCKNGIFGQNDEKWTLFALRRGGKGDFGHFPEGWKALRG